MWEVIVGDIFTAADWRHGGRYLRIRLRRSVAPLRAPIMLRVQMPDGQLGLEVTMPPGTDLQLWRERLVCAWPTPIAASAIVCG